MLAPPNYAFEAAVRRSTSARRPRGNTLRRPARLGRHGRPLNASVRRLRGIVHVAFLVNALRVVAAAFVMALLAGGLWLLVGIISSERVSILRSLS